eukprot:TRINITY_DN5344_c0_g1_i1.p1 TRINITY_DN5344_c0_g1~~TRINITY_DN5344_c0_g1_i1.p1  ORF type:complete len:477 (-),score=113.19 TRINITY_DN5344_c0_g1_i1:28-1458(-)
MIASVHIDNNFKNGYVIEGAHPPMLDGKAFEIDLLNPHQEKRSDRRSPRKITRRRSSNKSGSKSDRSTHDDSRNTDISFSSERNPRFSVSKDDNQKSRGSFRKSETESELILPEGWETGCDSNGRIFYIDHINQRTQWDHPSMVSNHRAKSPRISNVNITVTNVDEGTKLKKIVDSHSDREIIISTSDNLLEKLKNLSELPDLDDLSTLLRDLSSSTESDSTGDECEEYFDFPCFLPTESSDSEYDLDYVCKTPISLILERKNLLGETISQDNHVEQNRESVLKNEAVAERHQVANNLVTKAENLVKPKLSISNRRRSVKDSLLPDSVLSPWEELESNLKEFKDLCLNGQRNDALENTLLGSISQLMKGSAPFEKELLSEIDELINDILEYLEEPENRDKIKPIFNSIRDLLEKLKLSSDTKIEMSPRHHKKEEPQGSEKEKEISSSWDLPYSLSSDDEYPPRDSVFSSETTSESY